MKVLAVAALCITGSAAAQDAPRTVVHVVEHGSRKPIAGAAIGRLPSHLLRVRRAAPERNAGITDTEGRLRLEAGEHGEFAVDADGYVSAILKIDGPPTHEVALRPGHRATVQCVDSDGGPVADALVVLCSGTIAHPGAHEPGGVADPRSPSLLWTAASDAGGLARFDGLPRGDYRLYVDHHSLCALPGMREVTVPAPPLTVELLSSWGVVVSSPTESPIAWHVFRAARGLLARGSCYEARKARFERELQQRFPGCAAYVGLPRSPEQPVPLEVTARLADGTAARGEVRLVPLATITAPVKLEAGEALGLGRATVVVQAGGEEVLGIPLAFTRTTEPGAEARCCSGQTIELPAGSYAVGRDSPGLPLFDDHELEVPPGGAAKLVIELPTPLAPLEIVPRFLHGTWDTPVSMTMHFQPKGADEVEHSVMIADWTPGRRPPLRLWVPPGEATVSVTAAGHVPCTKEVHVRAATEEHRMELVLELSR